MTTELYERLEAQARALLDGESDFIANAGNFAALIYHELPDLNWAGFYLATPPGDLVLGPFSGRPACTRIPHGRGVCGAAAAKRETLVIDDVDAFADHIVCDVASRSEIVIPILRDGTLFGVFDVDSPVKARFTARDRTGLERLVAAFEEIR
ncbi:MAG TPA: GAF domain-containing protein [Candidatus Cybelea sp.]|nr:GAF domain-containing protein [Candidatus Cybelea sp.]